MLRKAGLPVEVEVMGRAVSRALADADRRGVAYAVIVGPEELKQEKVSLKDLKNRKQRTVEISNLTEEILSS
jgi:histidyl-tRNA synthetase